MSNNESLAERVYQIVQAARSRDVDPLEIRLTDSYRELQELAEKLDSRLDIDEMLNEVLGVKVNRVQELARVIASPEIYVARLKGKSTKQRNNIVRCLNSVMEQGRFIKLQQCSVSPILTHYNALFRIVERHCNLFVLLN